jgi:hypothetical protein
VTRRTSAKVAGAAYLVYTVVGFGTEVLMHQARGIEADPARLARMAEYVRDLRLAIVCTLLECLSALVLAVSLYGITRDEDQELALMGMSCRVVEGVLGTFIIRSYSGMLWLATSATGESHSPTAACVSTCAGPERPRRLDLLRRGEHDLLLPSPARTDGARLDRVVGRRRVRPSCGDAADSARRYLHGAAQRIRPVAARVGISARARAMVARQGGRHAEAVFRVRRDSLQRRLRLATA